ncbi:hypothetical protein ZHAS_00007025 [Anopheles sinensis]|uniref:Uncharacterized protein n=1 Tax=Anopheles sinensis TaxID=74873 RepID=A0A084VNN7_ANOSI|nr:hypothetical protein ZHAS_00007025 [Anopheles sinensis]
MASGNDIRHPDPPNRRPLSPLRAGRTFTSRLYSTSTGPSGSPREGGAHFWDIITAAINTIIAVIIVTNGPRLNRRLDVN